MSKKWVAFLLIVCIGLAGAVVYIRMNQDTKGPEITFTDQAPTLYHSDMNNSELLTGVTATDDKDGDVSSSLTVESVYKVDDTHVAVTYTAKDGSNNITKQKLELEMDSESIKDASEDTSDFGEKTDEADAPTGADAEASENNDSENADTSDSKSQDSQDAASAEETPEPTSEVDEAQAAKEKQEADADAMPSQNPKIYLTDYLIKIPVGTTVDLLSYVSEIRDEADDVNELWRKIQITGEVNSTVPGTYKCTYYVIDSQNNISNNAVLTVVVE